MAAVTRLPVPTLTHWSWQHRAACRGMDLDAFFHPTGERGRDRRIREDRAKRVCATCPVLDACRRWAHEVEEPFGVWGGESEDERRTVIRGERRDRRLAHLLSSSSRRAPTWAERHAGAAPDHDLTGDR